MGLTLLKLSSFCISEIIMLLLRVISDISPILSLIGFLCAYCISTGYPSGGPLDHCPAYEPLAGFGSFPRLLQPLWVIGIPRYSAGFAGQWSFAPAILRVVVPTGLFPLVFYGL